MRSGLRPRSQDGLAVRASASAPKLLREPRVRQESSSSTGVSFSGRQAEAMAAQGNKSERACGERASLSAAGHRTMCVLTRASGQLGSCLTRGRRVAAAQRQTQQQALLPLLPANYASSTSVATRARRRRGYIASGGWCTGSMPLKQWKKGRFVAGQSLHKALAANQASGTGDRKLRAILALGGKAMPRLFGL